MQPIGNHGYLDTWDKSVAVFAQLWSRNKYLVLLHISCIVDAILEEEGKSK